MEDSFFPNVFTHVNMDYLAFGTDTHCRFVGSILAAGSARGAGALVGNKAWQIPVWLQLAFPGLCMLLCWALPESPRWQYVNGKRDKAKAMLARYHGEGNPDSIWVELQLREYEEYLEINGADKRWWDYR